MIRKCVDLNIKAILVVPFVSIVKEKTEYLTRFLKPLGLKVGAYFSNSSPQFEKVNVAVCTFEKATQLINRLIDTDIEKMSNLGMVIVDEVHMVGDDSRGYLIEPLLAKLRYVFKNKIQIIGMSATLPNISDLATWLNAELYITDFRPIPLEEYFKIGNNVFDKGNRLVRTLPIPVKDDPDHLGVLIKETVDEGNSVLVFCSTKKNCQFTSELIAKGLNIHADEVQANGRKLMFDALKASPEGLDKSLSKTLHTGIAFHHAVNNFFQFNTRVSLMKQELSLRKDSSQDLLKYLWLPQLFHPVSIYLLGESYLDHRLVSLPSIFTSSISQ